MTSNHPAFSLAIRILVGMKAAKVKPAASQSSNSHYGLKRRGRQAKGRVDWLGYTTGGTASRCPNARLATLFSKKGFDIHLLMRNGRRGRRPSRAARGIYQHL